MALVNPEYSAWRTSADTISDASFSQYRDRLIHETAEIKRFLSETRAEHFIISAPKGFGKTLLLIAKRMQLNEHSAELDHGGEIVDRPAGHFELVSKDRTSEYKTDFGFWRDIWAYSISVAAINQHKRRAGAILPATEGDSSPSVFTKRLDSWTLELLQDSKRFRSPALIFTSLLDLDFSTRRKALGSLGPLSAMLNDVQSQTAFFIDNVDEYFVPVLENHSLAFALRSDADDQRKSNQIWINAQLALVTAAFNIHRVNHHIRVYCTVRSEALLKLREAAAEYAQILGHTVEISYTRKDLEIIFQKNVKLMGDENLFPEAPNSDSFGRFFGPDSKVLKHKFIERSENAFDFVLRHTFYRPRDLMTLCGKLALIPIEDRSPTRIKEEVVAESANLVHGILTEMKPFFRLPDTEDLLPCIRKNALTISELESSSAKYLNTIARRIEGALDDLEVDYQHPFCVLYQIGMLGWIEADQGEDLESLQRFVKPQDIEVDKRLGLPPTEKFYLIHPALDRLIFDRVGREYSQQFHRNNVIGFDLLWQEPPTSLFVIKADLCGFSSVMETELYESVSLKLHEWAKTTCDDLLFVEVTGGDSITMIDGSALNLLNCIFKLQKRAELHKERSLSFRFGGSAGPITFEKIERRINGAWESIVLPMGMSLRSSARLEPHAPKGKLIVDAAFVQSMQGGVDGLLIKELAPEDVPSLLYNSEAKLFTIQKSTTDPIIATRLYFIHFATEESVLLG